MKNRLISGFKEGVPALSIFQGNGLRQLFICLQPIICPKIYVCLKSMKLSERRIQ